MTHRLLNAALFVLLVGSLCWLGPSLDDLDYSSEAARKAIKHLNPQDRFERAAQEICGTNAAWVEVAPGVIQCFTHKGHKTLKASL